MSPHTDRTKGHHNIPSLHHQFQTFVRGTGLGLNSVLVGLPLPFLQLFGVSLRGHRPCEPSHNPILPPALATVPGLFTSLAEMSSLRSICGLEISSAWPGLEPL